MQIICVKMLLKAIFVQINRNLKSIKMLSESKLKQHKGFDMVKKCSHTKHDIVNHNKSC